MDEHDPRSHVLRRHRRVLARLTAAGLVAGLVAAGPAAAAGPQVKISRSDYGIPHIEARDYEGLGYGYGYALAQDNVCVVAESYVTVQAERARWFGEDSRYTIRGNGSTANNLNSDFFYKAIIDEGRVERLVAQAPPLGPKPEIHEGVRGYVAGYNAYLRDVGGADGVTDPTCRGKGWVRPIDEMTVYRRFYALALLASSGVAIDGIAAARPLLGGAAEERAERAVRAMRPGEIDERLGGLGSNAVALGKAATASGHGMVYGNPHFPWEGPERFYQTHLTIPGKLNVAGGSLFGVPLINIGWTDGMAWSHTVSTARRFTPYELRLVPGSPTTYVYDGEPREMTTRTVTVKALTEGGELVDRTRTLHWSHHGPILTGILGLPIFPWTPERAYAMGDANDDNFGRLLNHFFDVNHANSVAEVDAILKRHLGIPWVNTVAADTAGNAYYADIGSIPNVSDAKLRSCRTPLGIALDTAQRLPVLDGSTSACEWDTDADALAPGIFGPGNMPSLLRDDYTSNMNDSYWLTNPRQPIEGYARIIGEERTQRSLRTRGGLWLVEEELAAGRRFTLDSLREKAMSNRVPAAELWKEDLVRMCREHPVLPSSSGPVAAGGACDVLAAFNGRDDLDSTGAVLFRRFATRALAANVSPWRVGFSPEDPVDTPRGLNTENPQVWLALGDAIKDLEGAGIPLDAGLRGWQYERRGDEKVPIHGGPHGTGVFNVITGVWNAREGYSDIVHGSSYVQAVELTPGCPRARTILTYSQSTDPQSRHAGDQTRLYTGKGWVQPPFCAREMRRAKGLQTTHLAEGTRLLRAVRVTERRRRVELVVELARRATLTVTERRRARRPSRRLLRRSLRAGRTTSTLRLRRGTRRLALSARAGRTRETVRVTVRVR